ncbi:YdiU family protein [Fulvimarina endophytica]|uniref:Protein nucleotidyltransferase YdiU n=1 Tax=Fulvimarina endophytica TaxID=2293836 RepID=A0A371X4T1_9HYPH|nr:YdiU family protein [Fulvimarina endophytica]RFC64199.1 YdiU family protein [Fulvimarina endophytica]
MTVQFSFDNSYARLGAGFHQPVAPTPVAEPGLILLNRGLCAELGLDAEALDGPLGAEILSGNRLPEGAEPIAAAYAGHQFGNFVPQLGDGRAILLGEIVAPDGRRFDLQLKGSGPTAFSRSGDGRAALGPVLREYLVSEAMAALGIATTRALAATRTGEPVLRESVLPGAVLARIASSHVRVGTFQFHAARGDREALRRLADHVIARHDSEIAGGSDPYRAFFEAVCARQARLVARWMATGFVHGVMNTDNTSIAGETIDYGPCAFLDAYDPDAVFSSIDRGGRYRYANQPGIARWNLARLAECLLPLFDADDDKAVAIAEDGLRGFAEVFEAAHLEAFRAKIGLATQEPEDATLIEDLFAVMARAKADFTLTFRRLGAVADGSDPDAALREGFGDRASLEDREAFSAWTERWRTRLQRDASDPAEIRAGMDRVNPALIPRNHLVETALGAAASGDLGPFLRLNAALAAPFTERPDQADLAARPPERETPYRTFCGT